MAAKRINQTMTLAEFKAWLMGIEEMQDKGWCPSPSQWKLIRNKIECVVATPAQPFIPPAQPFVPQPTHTAPPGHPVPPFVPPAPPTFAHSQLNKEFTPSAPPMQVTPDGKIKTPNLDTSKDSYASSFE